MYRDDEKSIEEEVLEERENRNEETVEMDIISPNDKTSYANRFKKLNIKYKKDKKKYLLMISGFLLMLALTMGTSYAYLTYISKTDSTSLIEAGTLAIEFKNEQNSIMLEDSIPQSDEIALENSNEYEFTIENTGSLRASYVITLDNTCDITKSYTVGDEEITPDKCIPNEYIKVGLKIGEGEYKVLEKSEGDIFILDAGALDSREEKDYKMKVWLDIDTPNEYNSQGGKHVIYSGKLGLSYEQGKNNLDTSGANIPVLSDAMIPIYYDETDSKWKKADSTNTVRAYKWYDYNKKMWANSVTVTEETRETYQNAALGTEINIEDDVLTMQVWIPRYKYEVFNYNLDGTVGSEPKTIEITFENGTEATGEIECTDDIQGENGDGTSEKCVIKETSAACSNDTCKLLTYTHPAFTFGTDELSGFWVGKFENVSDDSTCEPTTGVAINEEGTCNVDSIRPLVKPNLASWRGAMVSVFETNMLKMSEEEDNKYGFIEGKDDTHMIKNMEWGAVAYLSLSEYGKNAEIEMNTNSEYTTGCGPTAKGNVAESTSCSTYETELGQGASTTGNIYGIYDMSGGASEYVMGNVVSSDGSTMLSGNSTSGNQHSGYTGNLGTSSFTGEYTYPEVKYYDKYSYGTTYNDAVARKRSKLGDAIREVYNTGNYGWYDDYNWAAYSSIPWFDRGGRTSLGSAAGLLSSNYVYGRAYAYSSSRLVISVLD